MSYAASAGNKLESQLASRPRKMGSSFVNCRVCRSFFVYQKGFVLVRGGVVQWGEKREIFSHFLERGGKKAYIPLA